MKCMWTAGFPTSLPALSRKLLCQASYHAKLCCLHLADWLSRRWTGMSLQFVTVLSEWKQVVVTCRSPSMLTSSLLCCSWQHPKTLSRSFSSLSKGGHDWSSLWLLRVSPMKGERSSAFPCTAISTTGHQNGSWSLMCVLEGRQPMQTHCGYGYWFLQWHKRRKTFSHSQFSTILFKCKTS